MRICGSERSELVADEQIAGLERGDHRPVFLPGVSRAATFYLREEASGFLEAFQLDQGEVMGDSRSDSVS